ncbi:hypothetical protein H2200_002663 [Cladophialophora chaetospira]|uniref:EngB-type G domain-containing protein n=1 Tax=Cladophialophora chaetospira TaxID=386627 RepID=A0AA39CMB4_9EURO|nr:hypothetical protein H2200_002663 [Cladophialophora chaetospira]
MQASTCFQCRLVTHLRFRQRLFNLQNGRRRVSSLTTPEVSASWYWDTTAPTKENLAAASHFFKNHKPSRLWTGDLWKSSELWRRSKKSSAQKILVPEVVFLGRSNVGKSTLINALAGIDLNRVSATPGMTEVMAAWGLSAKDRDGGAIKGWDGDVTPKVTLVDMPGYGFGSRSEWGNEIVSYLNKRRNLRRAFLLVDSVHGIMAADRHMLEIFQKLGIPFQLIATKCDRLRPSVSESEIRETLEKIKGQTNSDKSALMLGEIIAVGSLQDYLGTKGQGESFGIKNLQWAILKAANLEWYAMDKATVHKVIDKSATQRPQGKIDAEISHLIQRKGEETGPAKSADATTASSSLPNLSLQEFMREILGTGSEATAPSTVESKQSREPPRVFNPVEAGDNTRWKTPVSMEDKLSNAYKELQKLTTPLPEAKKAGSTSTSPLPSSRSSAQSSFPPKTVATGIEDFENMFSEPAQPPPARQALRQPQRQQAAVSRRLPQQTTLEGKGVARGIDAFEAMFAEPPKKSPHKQSTSGSGGRRKKRGAFSSGKTSVLQPQIQPKQPPAIVGKGVSRGLDAFESMFAEPPKKAKSRR